MSIERLAYTKPSDRDTQRQSSALMTKSGLIPIFFNPFRQLAACSVPHNLHIHSARVSLDQVLKVQPQVQIVPTISALPKSFPVVSIVKGMTFCLVDLTNAPDILQALKRGEAPDMELDVKWKPSFCGAMYYVKRGSEEKAGEPTIYNLHVRMITQGTEDPGTGSGNCALACYLALKSEPERSGQSVKSPGDESAGGKDLVKETEKLKLSEKIEHHVFAVEQGIEMGRKCTIAIEVDVKANAHGEREVAGVILSGRSMFQTKGEIMGTY